LGRRAKRVDWRARGPAVDIRSRQCLSCCAGRDLRSFAVLSRHRSAPSHGRSGVQRFQQATPNRTRRCSRRSSGKRRPLRGFGGCTSAHGLVDAAGRSPRLFQRALV
jgi:hypothetical protein